MLNIPPPKPAKKTTTTPPPAPDPILTGAKARTAKDRLTLELPDIVFADNQPGGSAIDLGTAANDINLDLDRLIKETLGDAPMGEHNAPRQTDLTALLDLINTDPIGRPDPTPVDPLIPRFFDLPSPTATSKPPKPTLPQLGTLVSTSKTDSSVGIPVSKQETARLSNNRNSQTVKIPESDFPSLPPLPDLPNTSESSNLPPVSPDLPSLTETSGGLPPLTEAFGGLPSLSQTSIDLPPPRQPIDELPSLTQTSDALPPLSQTSVGLPPLSQSSVGLPPLSQASGGLPPLPQTPNELPPLSQASGELPSLSQASGRLPPLSQSSGGFPSFTESSGGSPLFNDNSDAFSSFADTPRGFPSQPSFPDEGNNRIPGGPRSLPDPSESIFNSDPRFQSAFQPQGVPRSPFTSRIPTDPRTSDLREVGRLRNPFAPASQLPRRQGLSRAGRLPSRESLSNVLSEEQLQSNDPNLLPFAENVLSQVQQLVNRLKDNRGISIVH